MLWRFGFLVFEITHGFVMLRRFSWYGNSSALYCSLGVDRVLVWSLSLLVVVSLVLALRGYADMHAHFSDIVLRPQTHNIDLCHQRQADWLHHGIVDGSTSRTNPNSALW